MIQRILEHQFDVRSLRLIFGFGSEDKLVRTYCQARTCGRRAFRIALLDTIFNFLAVYIFVQLQGISSVLKSKPKNYLPLRVCGGSLHRNWCFYIQQEFVCVLDSRSRSMSGYLQKIVSKSPCFPNLTAYDRGQISRSRTGCRHWVSNFLF